MTDHLDVAKASADATKAIAEAGKSGIEAARAGGGFFAKIFGGALEEYGAAWRDKAAYFRWKNLNDILEKAEAISGGDTEKLRPLRLSLAIPIIEKASLEDDPSLQDMWAALIANSASSDDGDQNTKIFADVLASLSPLDARLLKQRVVPISAQNFGPNTTSTADENISLSNLVRLGCLRDGSRTEIGALLRKIPSVRDLKELGSFRLTTRRPLETTELGRALVDACTVGESIRSTLAVRVCRSGD